LRRKFIPALCGALMMISAGLHIASLSAASDEILILSFKGTVYLQEGGETYQRVESAHQVRSGSLIKTGSDSEVVLQDGSSFYKLYAYSKARIESAPSLLYGKLSVSNTPEFETVRFFYTPKPVQGKTLKVVLLSTSPVSRVDSLIYNESGYKCSLFFYSLGKNNSYRALTGFDVEAKPAKYYLKINAVFAEEKGPVVQEGNEDSKPVATLSTTILYPFYLKKAIFESGKVYLPIEQDELILPSEQKKEESKILSEVVSSVTPEALWQNRFSAPVEAPVIISAFGKRRVYFLGGTHSFVRFHRGIDFKGERGDPVFSPQNAVVVFAQKRITTGNTLVLDHGQGVFSLFFHLDSIEVQSGDRVKKGEKIAAVGSTGISAGPHLHWGLMVNGVYVDPLDWINRTY
jgi:murein DD-endopeptidase MepM/ murein hydrolase activator NlpD